MEYTFFEYEEEIRNGLPFTYPPHEILEYIEGDIYDYIKYTVKEVNLFGNYQQTKDIVHHIYDVLYDKIEELDRRTHKRCLEIENRVNINRETLKNIVEVSTDVRPNNSRDGYSWATISIGGKCQYVKFIDLNRRDMMDIVRFLKQYEAGRHVIDTPYRRMFEDELFYFKKDNE